MVVPLPSKQEAGVRFPLSALQPIEPLYLKDNEKPNLLYTVYSFTDRSVKLSNPFSTLG